MQLAGFDGKGAGSLAFLLGREGVLGIADEPHEWVDLIRAIEVEMNRRYAAIRAWRRGDAPKPRFDHDIGVVVDELVDIRDQAGDAFLDPFGQVVRLGREAGIHVISSVLRPDVAESLPGLIRASHSARLMLGTLHDEVTAKMMFGTARWRDALAASSEEDAEIPGRGIALLAGRIYRVQEPWVPDPAEDPRGIELWLPPRSGGGDDPPPTPPGPWTADAEPVAARVVPISTRSPKRRGVPTQRRGDPGGARESGVQR
jgi:DNA segregation ATPase FtsK/SpoIIIE-like protein